MAINHDQLMKDLIAAFPDQFLCLAAPELAARIDPGTLAFEPEEHFSGGPTGQARRGDLVTRASPPPEAGAGGAEEVLLHVEIELRHRSAVAPRLLRYHRGLSLKHALAVHTLVLYLRGGPGGSRERVYEERSLGRVVATLGYHSLGLSQAPAAEYLARPEPLAWALASLMRPARGQRRSKLGLECVLRIAGEARLSRDERYLLWGCVLTYADFTDEDALEFDRIVNGLENEEVHDVRMSMTERWRREGLAKGLEQGREQGLEQGREQGLEQGREQGLEQGREQGKEQGRAEGVRDLVLQLLSRRFGSLPGKARRRVAEMSSAEELNALAERLFQGESLEELGLA